MKKLIALILVLALIASLGVTASAAESAGTNEGDAPADRALAATVLWVMAGQPVVNYAPSFEDLDPEGTYMHAVRWAAAEGIIKGYNDKTFGPDDPITREQLAVMLYRYAQKNGLGFTGAWYFPLNYADAGDVSSWADEAMHWVVMNSLLEPADGKLLPAAAASRKVMSRTTLAYINGAGAETAAFHRVQLGTAPYTILIPDIYVQGELTEEDIAYDAVAFYYNDYSEFEIGVFQTPKESPTEQLMDYATSHAADFGAEVIGVEVNGIPAAQLTIYDTYEDVVYAGLVTIIDNGTDFVELVLWTDGKASNFEAHSVLNSLEKSELDVAEKIIGRWMIADSDNLPVLTNEKAVFDFISDTKAYVNASYTKAGAFWIDQLEAAVAIDGNKVTLTGHPDENTTSVDEYVVTAINDSELTANRKLIVTVNGAVKVSRESVVRYVKVNTDYSDAILGVWEGRCTSEGSVFDDGQDHRWEYRADGSYVYYVMDGESWVPSDNTLNEYFVAGNLLCTRWVSDGVESHEWWEVTIDDNTMHWTALRADENNQPFTATFVMEKVNE